MVQNSEVVNRFADDATAASFFECMLFILKQSDSVGSELWLDVCKALCKFIKGDPKILNKFVNAKEEVAKIKVSNHLTHFHEENNAKNPNGALGKDYS